MFGPEHILAAPTGHAWPFQLFDLQRIRRLNWTDQIAQVVQHGYEENGTSFCHFGEGSVFSLMLNQDPFKRRWYFFSSSWAYEPWQDFKPAAGGDIWSDV